MPWIDCRWLVWTHEINDGQRDPVSNLWWPGVIRCHGQKGIPKLFSIRLFGVRIIYWLSEQSSLVVDRECQRWAYLLFEFHINIGIHSRRSTPSADVMEHEWRRQWHIYPYGNKEPSPSGRVPCSAVADIESYLICTDALFGHTVQPMVVLTLTWLLHILILPLPQLHVPSSTEVEVPSISGPKR